MSLPLVIYFNLVYVEIAFNFETNFYLHLSRALRAATERRSGGGVGLGDSLAAKRTIEAEGRALVRVRSWLRRGRKQGEASPFFVVDSIARVYPARVAGAQNDVLGRFCLHFLLNRGSLRPFF